MRTKKQLREAALKAWDTRRKQADFEKRSKAAKKAWNTMRINKLLKQR